MSDNTHLLSNEELASFQPILRDLMESEYHYLVHSMNYYHQKALFPHWAAAVGDDKGPFPAQHILHSVEVAMVVAGIKPCLIAKHGSWDGFGKFWLEGVFLPWRDKYKSQLDRIGLTGMLTPPGPMARYWDGHPNSEP